MLHVLQIEGKILHQQKITTHFIVVLTLLQWCKTQPPASVRYGGTASLFWLCGTVRGAEKAQLPFTVLLFIMNILILTRITWAKTSWINCIILWNWYLLSGGKAGESALQWKDLGKWVTCQLNNQPSLISLALKSHCVFFIFAWE